MKIAFVMDPIAQVNITKDSTFALMMEGQKRGHELYYLELPDLYIRDGGAWGIVAPISVRRVDGDHFSLGESMRLPLRDFDCVFMRKDPPFDMNYIFATYILEHAQTLVVNDPISLRNANEKLYALHFSEFMAPTVVSSRAEVLREFLDHYREIVIKPLYGRGGEGVFVVVKGDRNTGSIFDTMTEGGRRKVMAQRFIPEVRTGDKRVLMIDGEVVEETLLRVPAEGDFRGNMVAGATPMPSDLTDREREISAKLGPRLKRDGLFLVGLDLIGGYLSEINVTSPTGIQEIERFFKVDVCGRVFDALEGKV